MCFSPDNKSLAIARDFEAPPRFGEVETVSDMDRGLAQVLEVASGRHRRKFEGHTDEVASVAFSPDSKILATGSLDTTILLWDMRRPVRPEAAEKTTPERLDFYWRNLAEQDGACAYDTVLALAAMPGDSVPFLAEPEAGPCSVKRTAGAVDR